ncbi:cytochrome b/b6 domain-containing protein [Dyella jiangningensis]|uniref:cytochrome b/b6 domain-containing protein n=1 Tax=Dyella jiangningensis TaxID=1379159 RepID=UPI0024100D12|nr:cytochrome b/b6 domain-containing protein [Dyella jiangningensis]MDG2538805.1 cytochrome b/b6 domain-containing protein [Dyella jiangningensis]
MAIAALPDQPKETKGRVLVWDAPVRVTHWAMVICFFGAYLTAEEDKLRSLHVALGYTLAILVAFRLFWGVIGTRYSLFKNFVRGPRAVGRYVRTLLAGRPKHYVGHNPAGALAIVTLLGMAALVTASGWMTYRQGDGGWAEEFHELVANLMLVVVGVHVIGVLTGSWLHHENLIGAMISGRKPGNPADSIERAMWLVAAILCGILVEFWWLLWTSGS